MDRPDDYLVSLVHELRKLPRETEWLEFKVNVYEPQELGEYMSALANSATLSGKAFAYLVWGIADGDHTLVGSTFRPSAAKIGNETFAACPPFPAVVGTKRPYRRGLRNMGTSVGDVPAWMVPTISKP
jgi:hypothetical protein